jgi:hypothetical protein
MPEEASAPEAESGVEARVMLFEGPTNTTAKRNTLEDYFAQLAESPGLYLQYDNGYRSWSYTYAQVGTAARTFSARTAKHTSPMPPLPIIDKIL